MEVADAYFYIWGNSDVSYYCHADDFFHSLILNGGIISPPFKFTFIKLIYLGRVTQICVKKLTTIGSDNGLSPGRRLAIIWNNAVIYLIRHIGKNFSEFLIEIQTFT